MRRIHVAVSMLAVILAAVLLMEIRGPSPSVLAAQKSYYTASPSEGMAAATASPSDGVSVSENGATLSDAMKTVIVDGRDSLIRALTEEEGDTVVLSSDIEWEGDGMIEVSRPVTVFMGDYSLRVPKDSFFFIKGPVVFRGNGGGRPLIDVEGSFNAYGGAAFEAEGDRTTTIRAVNNIDIRGSTVTARGEKAAAIVYNGDRNIDLFAAKVRAWGEASVGIRCSASFRAQLCSIEAEGQAITAAGKITADGSFVSPMPSGAVIIGRKAYTDDRMEDNGICIEAGSDSSAIDRLKQNNEYLTYSLVSGESKEIYLYVSRVEWTEFPFDLSSPASFPVYRIPKDVPEWFPVELPVQKVLVHIVDGNTPFLESAMDAGNYVYLRYFKSISDAGELLLEYSTDGGSFWRSASAMEVCNFTTQGVEIGPVDPKLDYWFRLTVTGGSMAGVSNVLPYRSKIRDINGGGDRDYDDRWDQGEEPPACVIIPPPPEAAEEKEEEPFGNGNETDSREEGMGEVNGPMEDFLRKEHGNEGMETVKRGTETAVTEGRTENAAVRTDAENEPAELDTESVITESFVDGSQDRVKEKTLLFTAGAVLLGGGSVIGLFVYRKKRERKVE